MKIAMIFPYAPSYRDAIYRLMDSELDIDWYFAGNCKPNLRLLDYSILKNCDLSLTETHIGPFSRLKGMNKLRNQNYDAVIIPGVFTCLSDMWLILKNSISHKTKIYLWTHGWYGKESLIKKFIKHLFFSRVDGILLYGDRARDLMIAEGYDKDKLFAIHNSLDYDTQLTARKELKTSDIYKKHFNNNCPTLIFIGRLTPVKRLNLIIEALNTLKSRGEIYNMVFVGTGSMLKDLREQVLKLGLTENVWFYGESFDERANAELIFNADLCVSPGNVGLTAIHSLMFGCPVITNDDLNTQMPEFEVIKPGITGNFFQAYSSDSLADTISDWFLNHKDNRENVRIDCNKIIDMEWNPQYQYGVINNALKLTKNEVQYI